MIASFEFKKQDNIKNFFILLFITKPSIDLLWAYSIKFLGFRMSPLHFVGLIVFIYLTYMLLIIPKQRAPYIKLLFLFIVLNFISAIFGFILYDRFTIPGLLNLIFRIVDSVVVYGCAFALGRRNRTSDWEDIVKAIVVGIGIAIILNHMAILFGLSGGMKVGAASVHSSLRERGLYYDPGGLAIVALNGFIFITYALKHIRLGKKILPVALLALLSSVFLMIEGLSRSVFILLAFYTVAYFVVFGKFREKALYIIFIGAVLFLAGSYSLVEYDRLTVRFQGDIEAVTNIGTDIAEGKEVSTKDLAALGSNRGRNWIVSLEWIFKRGPIELLFGNSMSTPAHSDYVDVLSRNGIIGLTLYLFIMFSFLYTTFKESSKYRTNTNYHLHIFSFLLVSIYMLYSVPFRPLSYTTTAWYMWATLGFSMAHFRTAVLSKRKKSVTIPPSAPKTETNRARIKMRIS